MQKMDVHNITALTVVLLSFGFLYALLFVHYPKENEQMINIFGGAVCVTGIQIVLNYLFGSSKKQAEPPPVSGQQS